MLPFQAAQTDAAGHAVPAGRVEHPGRALFPAGAADEQSHESEDDGPDDPAA
jgi:hypothetical protein